MSTSTGALPVGYDPWRHAARISAQLAAWGLASVALGAALLLMGPLAWLPAEVVPVARGFGIQCLVWGAIDGAIALLGMRDLRRRRAAGEHTEAGGSHAFAARLRKLLRLNAGLDVVYVLAGLALVLLWRTPEGLGHGLGVMVQGGFLLAFDGWHGWLAPQRRSASASLPGR